MITLQLTRDNAQDGVYLKLPATSTETGEALAELDAIGAGSGPIKIVEAISNVYNLGGYLKNVDIERPGELEKLGVLAQKMQTLDRNSCFKFEGVLDANSVNGIDDILRLSEMLDEYILLPDAANGSSLGKYLVENSIAAFDKGVWPYLDYQIIGSEFCAEHGGAFCRAGYVVRKEELPTQIQEKEKHQERTGIITLLLQTPAIAKKVKSVFLPLPATETEMESARQALGVDDFTEAGIRSIDYSLPYLGTMIPQDCVSVEDANELALTIEEMQQSDGELLKYLAALEVEQPNTFVNAYNLALDLYDYERILNDADEYGRDVLRRIGADDELLATIDGFTDFAELGSFYMKEDGVIRTEFGLIRRLSEPFDTQARGGMQMS